MPELERICDNVMTPDKTHSSFRLWLTTCPAKSLPVSILEKGILYNAHGLLIQHIFIFVLFFRGKNDS
jgi:hypothetical protein